MGKLESNVVEAKTALLWGTRCVRNFPYYMFSLVSIFVSIMFCDGKTNTKYSVNNRNFSWL